MEILRAPLCGAKKKQAATKAEEEPAKVSEQLIIVVKSKCDLCGTIYNSEEELNAHNKSDHKTLPSPEKERSMASLGERQLSPIHMQRDGEKKVPLLPLLLLHRLLLHGSVE